MDLSLRVDPKPDQSVSQKPRIAGNINPAQKARENLKLEAQAAGIPFQVYLQGFIELIEMILAASKVQAVAPDNQQGKGANMDVKPTNPNEFKAYAPENEKELPKTIVVFEKEEVKETRESKQANDDGDVTEQVKETIESEKENDHGDVIEAVKETRESEEGNDHGDVIEAVTETRESEQGNDVGDVIEVVNIIVGEAPRQLETPEVEEQHVRQFIRNEKEEFVAPVKQEVQEPVQDAPDISADVQKPEVKRELPVLKLDRVQAEEPEKISLNVSDTVNQLKAAADRKVDGQEQAQQNQQSFQKMLESQIKSSEEVQVSVESSGRGETAADTNGERITQPLQQVNPAVLVGAGKAGRAAIPQNVQAQNSEQVQAIGTSTENRGQAIRQETPVRTEHVPDPKEPESPEIIERIVKITKMMRANGKTSVKVSITTERLGEVRVRLVMRGKELNVTFHTDNSEVDRLVQANSDHLYSRLKSEGISTINLKFEQNKERDTRGGYYDQRNNQKYHEDIFSAMDEGGEEDKK